MYGKYGPLYVQVVFLNMSMFIKMNTEVFRPLCEVLSN